jgi:molybdate transport system ATP-binding protein
MIRLKIKKRLFSAEGEMDLAVDMRVSEGDFVTLFGKSGAGKTTLLRILAGLDAPDEGVITVGEETWYDSAAELNLPPQRRRVGFLFQDYALFPNMTVRKNMEFALDKRHDRSAVDELLRTVGLQELSERLPDTLSGGQKQRVALARALVRRPKILLLDEPLSALDLQMRLKLQDELLDIHRRFGVTTLMVSHDLSEIFKLSDKVFMIENGGIVRSGTPSELFMQDELGGKFRFTGEVLRIEKEGVVHILTLLIGNSIVRVVGTDEEVRGLRSGDRISVASKAFNPIIERL